MSRSSATLVRFMGKPASFAPTDSVESAGAPRRRREELLKSPAYHPVRMYLKEICRVPLLSAAQEVDLAMRIDAGKIAGELLASLGVSGRVDRKRFRGVVDSV